jgi:hypothetical protein
MFVFAMCDHLRMPEQAPQSHDTYSPRAVLLALGLVLLLVLGGLFLFYALHRSSEQQDCMMQGRSNCAPLEPTTPGN